jgi:hypothetical protein
MHAVMLSVAVFDNQEDSMESDRAIMERQTARRAQNNVSQMVESLFSSVIFAKDLAARCKDRVLQLTDDVTQTIAQDLENVLQNIYDDLGSISAFSSNAYMDVLMKSQGYSEAYISMNVVNNKPRSRSLCDIDTPRLVDFLQGMYHESHEFGGQMFSTLPEVAEYIEAPYDAFLCPLTNELMNDPVTTESGVTYERRAIEEYIERFVDSSEPIYCPVTNMPMQSKTMMSNASLKSVIEEWTMRNEAMRVRIARTALSLSTADTMVLESVHELKLLAKLRGKNRELMHKIGVTMFVARLLDNHNAQIRRDSLELLCLLVEDEEGKVSRKFSCLMEMICNL